MKSLWFVGGLLVGAILLVSVGVTLAAQGGNQDSKASPKAQITDKPACGCQTGDKAACGCKNGTTKDCGCQKSGTKTETGCVCGGAGCGMKQAGQNGGGCQGGCSK